MILHALSQMGGNEVAIDYPSNELPSILETSENNVAMAIRLRVQTGNTEVALPSKTTLLLRSTTLNVRGTSCVVFGIHLNPELCGRKVHRLPHIVGERAWTAEHNCVNAEGFLKAAKSSIGVCMERQGGEPYSWGRPREDSTERIPGKGIRKQTPETDSTENEGSHR